MSMHTAQAMGIFCRAGESQRRECGRLPSINTSGARERECKAKTWDSRYASESRSTGLGSMGMTAACTEGSQG